MLSVCVRFDQFNWLQKVKGCQGSPFSNIQVTASAGETILVFIPRERPELK
ncbi:hypothetical protein EMIT0373P_50121 [Pseudomonas chlororaphis]